jgi:hypothetical protein
MNKDHPIAVKKKGEKRANGFSFIDGPSRVFVAFILILGEGRKRTLGSYTNGQ